MNKSTIDQVYVKELDTLFDINDIRVPSVGTGDAGKTLSVGSDGRYTLAEQQSVQSDWSQSIGTAPDYIKNRTHWEDTGISRTCNVLEIDWDSFTTEYANGVTKVTLRSSENEGETILGSEDVGIEVEIVINGTTYHATTYDSFMFRADGSNTLIDSVFHNGQPELDDSMYDILFQFDFDYGSMFVLYFPTTVLSTVTSFEVNVISSVVHKLDAKFIPISGTNDGTNWTSLTLGNETKNIAAANSGVLTVTQNSVTVGTFSANEAVDKTIDLQTVETLPSLTDVTISSVADGQILQYDETSGKWVNTDAVTEILYCTLTYTVEYDENTGTFSISTVVCDKTESEIYDAYDANKVVLLKVANIGGGADEVDMPESGMVFRLKYAKLTSGTPDEYLLIFEDTYAMSFITIFRYMEDKPVVTVHDLVYSTSGVLNAIPAGWSQKVSVLSNNQLTIQKNGTEITTFTSGSVTNKTANITVPDRIGSLEDVAIGTLADGDVLTYDQTQGVWIGTAASGGTSIIMRTWSNTQA